MHSTDKSDPDYASYTLDELHDARNHVDRGDYPGRYRLILAEIERRAGHDDAAAAENRPAPVFPLARVTLVVVVLLLISGVMTVVSIGPENLLLRRVSRPVQKAVVAEYPGHRIQVSIEKENDGQRIVVVLIDSKYAGSARRRKEKAQEIASVAFAGHPRADEVFEVAVIYREAVGSAAANLATDRRYNYSPDEL